ncbi:MAG: hypothetical protein ACLVHV_01450 [Oscillospiraceae bacterium]
MPGGSGRFQEETRPFYTYYSKKPPKEQLHFVTFLKMTEFPDVNSQKIHAARAENSLPETALCVMIIWKPMGRFFKTDFPCSDEPIRQLAGCPGCSVEIKGGPMT